MTVISVILSNAGFFESNLNLTPLTLGNLPSSFGTADTPFSSALRRFSPDVRMIRTESTIGKRVSMSFHLMIPAGIISSVRKLPEFKRVTSDFEKYLTTSATMSQTLVSLTLI